MVPSVWSPFGAPYTLPRTVRCSLAAETAEKRRAVLGRFTRPVSSDKHCKYLLYVEYRTVAYTRRSYPPAACAPVSSANSLFFSPSRLASAKIVFTNRIVQ
jgi:hypothetical protein